MNALELFTILEQLKNKPIDLSTLHLTFENRENTYNNQLIIVTL